MDHTKNNKSGNIGHMIKDFYINWNYRRPSWRASFYYNCLSFLTGLSIVCTLIFQQLLKTFNFFINYYCEYEYINFILTDLLIYLTLISLICVFSFLLSRICSILSNFTINDFMSLGKWIERIGCTVKWFPWLLALLIIFWFIINVFNIITIYATPNLWCRNRLNLEGSFVANNCRLFEGRVAACTSDMVERKTSDSLNYVRKCNDLKFLKNHYYFTFVPDLKNKNYAQCTFNNINICILYKSLIYNHDVIEKIRKMNIEGCLRNPPKDIEDFYDQGMKTSDLYKYSQLFIIGSNVTFLFLMFFFYFLKKTTQFDGLFYQSLHNSDIFILRILRPLTPWS
ncbi:conserved Plasmodium membrane protein, unknown function [Plasmodium sp. gorilla clade G3]|nr:conserved Plasmodium membrane protein, unknown function [Plasmodium sp. gorilla clade G3]